MNYYTDTLMYAVDTNNELHWLATKTFDDIGCAYRSEVWTKGNYYTVYSGIDDGDEDTEVDGQKIELPDNEDWERMLNGGHSPIAENLLTISGLSHADIAAIITVRIYSVSAHPTSYYAELIRPSGVDILEGDVDELLPKCHTSNISIQKVAKAVTTKFLRNVQQS